MRLFKKISAYWNGRFKCNDSDLRFPPSCVYKYDKKQLNSFISGIISASTDEGEYYRYNHDSIIMLTNLHKLISDAGYEVELAVDHLEIYK